MIKIANLTELDQYLKDKDIVDKNDNLEMTVLHGGVSGDVIKVNSKNKVMVVKQALSQLKVKDDWFSDPKRIVIEKNCLQVLNKLIPKYVPELYFFDDEEFLYGMECAPNSSVMWKTDLLKGKIDTDIGIKVIESLVTVHNESFGNIEIAKKFQDKTIFYELRVEPYFETTMSKHPELKKPLQKAIKICMEQELVLVHGDFSPKNILVDNKDIYLLDFEVANYGAPAFDLAFFSNHFLLKAVKNKSLRTEYLDILNVMLELYFKSCRFMERSILEAETVLMLGGLFLARVDGKSPAEYIDLVEDKELIRKVSYKILQDEMTTIKQVMDALSSEISESMTEKEVE